MIYFYNRKRWELYDLANDIGEEQDLAARQPERLAKMARLLRSELQRHGGQWPVDRRSGTFADILPNRRKSCIPGR